MSREIPNLISLGNNLNEAIDLRTWAEAEYEIAELYSQYVRENHPWKDADGEPLSNCRQLFYDLELNNIEMPVLAKPQCISLLDVLEKAFYADGEIRAEPDRSPLSYVLVALVENGQVA